jgi:succinate dehydrogenase / fumarate reductase, cytochrome b subunit
VATTSLTRTQRVARTTVGFKALMAVSGLIMILYLLAHMYGNLKVFAGQEAFDEYAHHLRVLGEPLLPYSGALWVIRIVLLASVVVHMVSAFILWRRSLEARGGVKRYYSTKARTGVQRSYASFTLRWGGVVILLFVIYHLLHLTWNVVAPGGASDSPYQRLINGFQIWWVLLAYLVAMIAIAFHLRHGVWSALTTLGLNTSALARRRLNAAAYIVAAIVTIGFLLPPFAIFFRWVG